MNLSNKGNTEILNSQRPISSYQRYTGTENNRLNTQDENDKIEDINIDYKHIIQRLQTFISENNIALNEFCDNLNLFLDFNAFKDLFKKINFIINNSEAKILFNYNNPDKQEGYIKMQNFENNFKLNWKKYQLESINTSYDIKKINNQFKILNNEVYDLIQTDLFNDYNRFKPKRKILSSNTNKKTTVQSIELTNNNTKNSNEKFNDRINSTKSSKKESNFLTTNSASPDKYVILLLFYYYSLIF